LRERLVDDWLTRVHERGLEVPFCHLLSAEGQTVLHLSRHGEAEQGRDILALAPDGCACSYQLKAPGGRRLTLRTWARGLDQIERLVTLPPKHPGIPPRAPHRPFLIVNGELDEAVKQEILDRNADWASRGYPQLGVIVRGELRQRFLNIGSDLWPDELEQNRTMLELYLADGRGFLPKARLAAMLESMLLRGPAPPKAQLSRRIAAAGIATSYALAAFASEDNWAAQVEGWAVYLACVTALAAKVDLRDRWWRASCEIAEAAVGGLLGGLLAELHGRADLLEGDVRFEGGFYAIRMTILVGLCALTALWPPDAPPSPAGAGAKEAGWAAGFLRQHTDEPEFWGEAAAPYLLAAYWALRHGQAPEPAEDILLLMVRILTDQSLKRLIPGLPGPYASPETVVEERLGLARPGADPLVTDRLYEQSHCLESVVHLLARRGLRDELGTLWPQVTRMTYCRMVPDAQWRWFTWRMAHATHHACHPCDPPQQQSWAALRAAAAAADYGWVPGPLRQRPHLVLLFLLAYPHRICPDLVKLIDDAYSDPT